MAGATRLVDLVNAARGRCAGCMLLPIEAEELSHTGNGVYVCARARTCAGHVRAT